MKIRNPTKIFRDHGRPFRKNTRRKCKKLKVWHSRSNLRFFDFSRIHIQCALSALTTSLPNNQLHSLFGSSSCGYGYCPSGYGAVVNHFRLDWNKRYVFKTCVLGVWCSQMLNLNFTRSQTVNLITDYGDCDPRGKKPRQSYPQNPSVSREKTQKTSWIIQIPKRTALKITKNPKKTSKTQKNISGQNVAAKRKTLYRKDSYTKCTKNTLKITIPNKTKTPSKLIPQIHTKTLKVTRCFFRLPGRYFNWFFWRWSLDTFRDRFVMMRLTFRRISPMFL